MKIDEKVSPLFQKLSSSEPCLPSWFFLVSTLCSAADVATTCGAIAPWRLPTKRESSRDFPPTTHLHWNWNTFSPSHEADATAAAVAVVAPRIWRRSDDVVVVRLANAAVILGLYDEMAAFRPLVAAAEVGLCPLRPTFMVAVGGRGGGGGGGGGAVARRLASVPMVNYGQNNLVL